MPIPLSEHLNSYPNRMVRRATVALPSASADPGSITMASRGPTGGVFLSAIDRVDVVAGTGGGSAVAVPPSAGAAGVPHVTFPPSGSFAPSIRNSTFSGASSPTRLPSGSAT